MADLSNAIIDVVADKVDTIINFFKSHEMNTTDVDIFHKNSTLFYSLSYFDQFSYRTAHSLSQWSYRLQMASGLPAEALNLIIMIFVATCVVMLGSFASVSKPQNAYYPLSDDELYDPTDLDGLNIRDTKFYVAQYDDEDATALTTSHIVRFPIMAAAGLLTMYVIVTKVKNFEAIIHWFMQYISVVAFFAHIYTFSWIVTVVARRTGFLVGKDSKWLIGRYRLTMSENYTQPCQLARPNFGYVDCRGKYVNEEEFLTANKDVEYAMPSVVDSHEQIHNTYFSDAHFYGVFISFVLSGLFYLYPQNWLVANSVSLSLALFGIMSMKMTDFTVGYGLLGGLFFYDIYFVFYTDVMVKVATKLSLPIKVIVPTYNNFPSDHVNFKQVLENFKHEKLDYGLLGLGDIVIPAAFVALCLRYDLFRYHKNHEEQFHYNRYYPKPYFYTAVVSYVFGLLCCFVSLFVYRVAQPALLYIVPSLLLGNIICALFLKDVKGVYQYFEEYKDDYAPKMDGMPVLDVEWSDDGLDYSEEDFLLDVDGEVDDASSEYDTTDVEDEISEADALESEPEVIIVVDE